MLLQLVPGVTLDWAPGARKREPKNNEGVIMTNMPVSANIDALRRLTLEEQGYVLVLGYQKAGDGGGGIFFWSDTVETEDGGMIIEPIKGGPLWKPGCWKRIHEGPVNVKWFGARGDYREGGNTKDPADTVALHAAINWVNKNGGGTIVCPAGNYVLSSFTIPAGVIVRGAGKRATYFFYTGNNIGSGTLATIGGSAAELSYGSGISDCAIRLDLALAGEAIRVQDCVGAEVARIYIEGPIVAGRSTTGVVIDGGRFSSYFNRVTDVQCHHIQNGFKMVGTDNSPCTQTIFENCQSFGDIGYQVSGSVGFAVDKNQGHGSMWIGGNFENCDTGILVKKEANSVSVSGTRFEDNTTDVSFEGPGAPWSFFQCIGIDPAKIVNNSGAGYSNHQFIGCIQSNRHPFGNRLGVITNLAGKNVLVTAGSGSPDEAVTAGPGSIFLDVNGGSKTTFYVKESGTGAKGWVGK